MVILISICCVECVHIASESVVVHHIMPFLKIDTMRTLDCALVGLDIALAEDSKEVNKIRTHKKRALSLSLFVFNSLRNEDFVLVFVYMCRVLSFLYLYAIIFIYFSSLKCVLEWWQEELSTNIRTVCIGYLRGVRQNIS